MIHNGRLFLVFNMFRCQWSDSQMLRHLYKKVSLSSTITRCVAFQQLHKNLYIRGELWYFGILPLNLNKLGRQVFDWNAILNEQKSWWFLIQLFNLFLVSKDKRPQNGRMINNCFFSNVWWIFWYYNFTFMRIHFVLNFWDTII